MKENESERTMNDEAEKIRKNLEKTEANQMTNAEGKYAVLPDEPEAELSTSGEEELSRPGATGER